jgi:putative phosphoribosyl transferase
MPFRDRTEAGQRLAAALGEYRGRACVVLALPRGGVPVAAEVAEALKAPLDLLLVRKIGAPQQPELAIGSVIDGGRPIIVRDQELMRLTGTTVAEFDAICAGELKEIERRRKFYLGGHPPEAIEGRIAIVIDDGIATGNTMQAALKAARMHDPKLLVMAVPVAPRETIAELRTLADRVICLETPEPFGAVGYFYRDFRQVSDDEVIRILADRHAALLRQAEPVDGSNKV